MLIHEGTERTERINLALAGMLAAIAGALNTAAFLAAGLFSANMTGNVSAMSIHLASGGWAIAARLLAIVATFVFGAAVAGAYVREGRRRNFGAVFALGVLIEAALLATLAIWCQAAGARAAQAELVLGLAFAMGFQNAIATQITAGEVRTTHVSGIATDLGIEIAAWVYSAFVVGTEAPQASMLRLHVVTIAAFLIGGIGGVIIYSQWTYGLLWVCSLLLVAAGSDGLIRWNSHRG